MEQKFCQSCGMPLNPEVLGTEKDGSKNEEYCTYCYADGHFTVECTMDEMINPVSYTHLTLPTKA